MVHRSAAAWYFIEKKIKNFYLIKGIFLTLKIVKSAAGRYSAGCSYTCETSTASINYCTSSYCNSGTLVSTASSNLFVSL